MGMFGAFSKAGRRAPTPEEELAATMRAKERVMTQEMEINPALAKQVNDGDISLAEAQRLSANQNRRLGTGSEQVVIDDHALISSVRGADPDGTKLFEWKQSLPQKQKEAITMAEIEYKKGNPKPLAQLYRVMGVATAVGAGGALTSANANAGPGSYALGAGRKMRGMFDEVDLQREVAANREAELVENLGRDYAPTYTPTEDDALRARYRLDEERQRARELQENLGDNQSAGIARKGVGAATAATAASAGFASEDSEAGPLKLTGNLTAELAGRQLRNRLNKERQKGISPGNTATDYVHRNTNYDNGFLSSIKKSGEEYGGPTYTSGVKEFAQELIQGTQDPAVRDAVMEWVRPRMARGAAASAVTASAGAAANDDEKQERGPVASILDKMEQAELIPDKATRTLAMEFLSRELDSAIAYIQMPAQGLWGTARGLFGAATDEAPADTRRAMREVYTQPTDESLERAGRYVLKETGSPAAAAATYTLGMLTDPAFWL